MARQIMRSIAAQVKEMSVHDKLMYGSILGIAIGQWAALRAGDPTYYAKQAGKTINDAYMETTEMQEHIVKMAGSLGGEAAKGFVDSVTPNMPGIVKPFLPSDPIDILMLTSPVTAPLYPFKKGGEYGLKKAGVL